MWGKTFLSDSAGSILSKYLSWNQYSLAPVNTGIERYQHFKIYPIIFRGNISPREKEVGKRNAF
ncbi:MAG: hypothetical protein CVU62_04075 [Deltaproteobacteria bacterium HGW-Deltaproteobacteria-2]|nr:MAG: hypothetical protein CVU62_04075 [Deltaproteobacteria bacterium HGW-Deltaproteobacteria-2]